MKPRKYLDIEDAICAAYLHGDHPCDIAARFDVPRGSVGTILRRRGVQKSRAHSKRQKILSTFKPGLPVDVVAEQACASVKWVRAVLSECGLNQGAAQ